MLTELGGKIMTYDGENRPLSVTLHGKRTCYVYGADSARLRKVENHGPTQHCTTIPATAPASVFRPAGGAKLEIVRAGQVITYPHPNVKITNGVKTYLHRDALGYVRAITDAPGIKIESAIYKPFGEQTEWLFPTQPAPEAKGWIGEHYDADAGLQYLNARYYDPILGMFIQPDWFRVMQTGVGTNRSAIHLMIR